MTSNIALSAPRHTIAGETGPAAGIPWWKRTTVYQLYPRSFADHDGDGIGDLPGIIGRLDYLRDLGVETIWLSPFFESPQADFGYDISDHLAIAPEYGTLEDVKRLIDELHARGMKIVFDMVLNHTSNQNPWFLESASSRESPKRDWYIWRDGRGPGGRKPPNNWRSMVGGSGWHWHEPTGQWYWASFLPFQPDLNYRNPVVKKAMLDVVRHWLRLGVDGLRLDIFNALFKDASFADNPFSFRPVPSERNPHGFFQRHTHTIDHPDTIAFAAELRKVVDEFDDPPRFLVGEVFGDPTTLRRYCGEEANALHLVFLFESLRTAFRGPAVRSLIEQFERAFPEPFSPTYVFGNHDRPRFIHRLGEHRDKAKLIAALQLTVRGVPFVYYGEEIGMSHHEIPLHEGLDPVAARYRFVPQWLANFLRKHGILLNRDECRLPMQWDSGPNAGFAPASATPWLPMHPRSRENNVAAQERDPESLLRCYKSLLSLRREHVALQVGSLELLSARRLPPDVVGYRRSFGEGRSRDTVDVLLNFGRKEVEIDIPDHEQRAVYSNRRGETRPAQAVYKLAPYEGVALLAPDTGARPLREPARPSARPR
jgi:oligo-1,6-glucosidase/alpha-glucosidase